MAVKPFVPVSAEAQAADPCWTYNPAELALANPPPGYVPITSTSPFGGRNGPFFSYEMTDGRVRRGFRLVERHTNGAGIAHGGMTMLFADALLGTVAFHHMQAPCATVKMVVDFVDSPRPGDWVEGIGREIGRDGDMVILDGQIFVGDRIMANLSAIFKRMVFRS